jgi:CheY-like chemotaxis protein
MLLEHLGYRVLTANSGREGLALFATHPVTAVVLDYRMPEMDGGQVAAEIRRLKPDVKILLLSAYLDLPQELLNLVDGRVVKGTSPTAFLTALRQLLPACNRQVPA